jgi:predicted RNase H-like HicB family nuclease
VRRSARRVVCDRAGLRYRVSVAAHTFNVVFEDAGDGWVYAHVPELPEVHTQGETLDAAREMVRDAIALVLDERRARGESIPPTGWALVESVEIAA